VRRPASISQPSCAPFSIHSSILALRIGSRSLVRCADRDSSCKQSATQAIMKPNMPAAAEKKLSLEEFHARYDGEKPYYGYWDGEAVQKSMPTAPAESRRAPLRGTAGQAKACPTGGCWIRYLKKCRNSRPQLNVAATCPTTRSSQTYEPIPDIVANDGPLGLPYPAAPFRRCDRNAWSGVFRTAPLERTDVIAWRGDAVIPAKALWDEVNSQLASAS